MTKGILREVSYEIDAFEMKHYNEEKKGLWEEVTEDLDKIDDTIQDDLRNRKNIDPERVAEKIEISLANARCEVDDMESTAVQNGLVRSKHLQNLMLAAGIRDTLDTENWYAPDIDHVEIKVPWFFENNLIEKLYLKYHKTRIHKCFDIVHKYLLSDFDNPDAEYCSSSRCIYVFWKEIQELWEEVDDEETLSNHYHDGDDYWDYDIDPKECKNLKDFFRKRVKVKINNKKEEERLLLERAKEDKKKEKQLKILRAKEHKLRNYTSIEEFSNNQQGSVYWFIDVNKKFTKYSKFNFGVLYVGESKNFDKRFSAYAIKSSDKFTELESKLSRKFPDVDKDSIQKFVRDPQQCKLMVKRFNFLSDDTKRLDWERRVIRISQPLLNRGGRLH
jgi:hypothetical protein|tara:strand:- start:239 stop:1405 length:1167 start_codon:yes stop_codon:yes gene_type:complete